jgi:hypothetical protein
VLKGIGFSWNLSDRGAGSVLPWQLIVQDYMEQRLMYLDTTVVLYETEFTKAIHEKTYARPCGPDHLRQGFLRNLRDQAFRFSGLSEFRHQQKNPSQTLFTGVEKLINQVGLDSHTAGEKKLEEKVGEGMLFVHHTNHLIPLYSERCTSSDCGSSRQTTSHYPRNRLFANEIAGGKQGNCGFFTCRRNDRQLRSAFLDIKDRVSRTALRRALSPSLGRSFVPAPHPRETQQDQMPLG